MRRRTRPQLKSEDQTRLASYFLAAYGSATHPSLPRHRQTVHNFAQPDLESVPTRNSRKIATSVTTLRAFIYGQREMHTFSLRRLESTTRPIDPSRPNAPWLRSPPLDRTGATFSKKNTTSVTRNLHPPLLRLPCISPLLRNTKKSAYPRPTLK